MPDPVTAAIGVGGTVVSSAVGAYGAKEAAKTSAASADRAAQLQYDQYLQSRQDMLPYMQFGVGTGSMKTDLNNQIESTVDAFIKAESGQLDGWIPGWTREDVKNMLLSGQSMGQGWDDRWGAAATELQGIQQQIDTMPDIEGALPQLYEYWPSQLNTQDYLPDTEIPVYDVDGNIVKWQDTSQIPEYGEVDILSLIHI